MALRPVTPVDIEWLRRESLGHPSVGIRWRFRGITPDAADFSAAIGREVAARFVIEQGDSLERCGFVQLMNYDRRNGTARLTYVVDEATAGTAWHMEAAFLFVNYCFMSFPLRKIYLESLDYSFEDFASGDGRWFVEEGRLRSHEFYDGEYLDLHILAIYRSTWEAARAQGSSLLATDAAP